MNNVCNAISFKYTSTIDYSVRIFGFWLIQIIEFFVLTRISRLSSILSEL